MSVNYTTILDHWMIRCFEGGKFYVCKNASTEFVGCCDTDPCTNGSGICPKVDLHPMSHSPGRQNYRLSLTCDDTWSSMFYRCNLAMPHFLGCCSVDPCTRGCLQNQTTAAKLPWDEGLRQDLLGKYDNEKGSRPITASGSQQPNRTFESIDFPSVDWDGGRDALNPATVIGISAGIIIAGLMLFGLMRRYRPYLTFAKGDPSDQSTQTPFLTSESTDDVADSHSQSTLMHVDIPTDWHGGPKTLWYWDTAVILNWSLNTLLTFTPLWFIALAVAAVRLDNRPHSDYGKTVVELTRLAPTLYPIIFAAITGRFYKVLSRWRLERPGGVSLAILEQMIGSQSFATAIQRVFAIRTHIIVSLIVLASWVLSPIGGQSASRLLRNDKFNLTSNGTVYYADPAYQMPNSKWLELRHKISATYTASLLSSSEQRHSPRDIWGLPKIPQWPRQRFSDDDHYNVNKSDLESGKAFYSSLLGIKVQGLAGISRKSRFHFTIPTSYFEVECQFVDSFDPIRERLSENQTLFLDMFYRKPSFSSFNLLQQERLYPTKNDLNSPYQFSYVKQLLGSKLYVVNCSLQELRVETTIQCGPGDPANTCEARQQRRVSTSNQRGNSTFPPSITRRQGRLLEIGWAFEAWVNDSCDKAGVQSSSTETYLVKDVNPFKGPTKQQPWTKEDLSTFPFVFSRRMTTALNTFWDAGLLPGGHIDILYNTAPAENINGLETHRASDHPFMNTTIGTRTITVDVYSANWAWVGILLFTTTVLQILAICGLVLQALVKGPDVMGFASTMTRDNPYVPLPPGGSHLDGSKRAKLLKDLQLELADIHPEDKNGYLAVRAVTSAVQQHIVINGAGKKSNQGVQLDRKRIYE